MKRTLTYVILGTALLLSNRLFVSSGWAAETDVISFASRKGGNFTLHFTNTRGEILRHITFKTPSMYGHTWSPSGKWIAYVLTEVIGPLKPVLLPSERLFYLCEADGRRSRRLVGNIPLPGSSRLRRKYSIDVDGKNLVAVGNRAENGSPMF